ncbi:hypothetical protein CC1G_14046 [Coprinopsis cinerea okayama7|uniref:Uncharacterized protein n=1 Tax=Coprinopsis cinerea (strain Okayama-7 / 130 / ATCC MYA-4618 / FGSC 9003) TaxID=240176 RepID=D6RL22_COPC7|nr:hypothetical protein CC1G_14046 [Coprinopsis cinerea okayama7\|eukprot:XP_002912008.1 hypothetical protein CC1G_14046 [Coprinopsis cinerea okayama7\
MKMMVDETTKRQKVGQYVTAALEALGNKKGVFDVDDEHPSQKISLNETMSN